MNDCPFELMTLALLEQQLPEAQRAYLEAHRQRCPQCQRLSHEWARFEPIWASQLPTPQLSPSFNTTLARRLSRERRLLPERVAEDRRRLEEDYRAGLSRLRRQSLAGYPWITLVLGVGACLLALWLGIQLPEWWADRVSLAPVWQSAGAGLLGAGVPLAVLLGLWILMTRAFDGVSEEWLG